MKTLSLLGLQFAKSLQVMRAIPLAILQAISISLMISVGFSSAVRAELAPVLVDAGWDEIIFDDQPSNVFQPLDPHHLDLVGGIRLISQSTVSIAFFNTEADLSKTPNLSWEWQVETPIINTDLKKKGGDDRSLAIYVAFPYQPEVSSLGEKIKRKAIEALKGKDTPGRILTYVWGGGAPKRNFVENPYTGKYGAMIYQRTPKDSSGEWLMEQVDLRADFIKAFGYEPASPVYIGIGADSDDTKSRVVASVREMRFTP